MRNIYEWLGVALKHIRYQPDHDAAYQELKGHFEDHCEFLEGQGIPHETAEKQALEAMGDASETGRMMASVYRPALTFFWRLSRVLVVCLMIAVVIAGLRWGQRQSLSFFRDPEGFILNTMTVFQDGSLSINKEGHCYKAAKLGEFTFEITKAVAGSVTDPEHLNEDQHYIFLVIRAKGPMALDSLPNIGLYMTAVDDKGVKYSYPWPDYTDPFINVDKISNYAADDKELKQLKRLGSGYYLAWLGPTAPDVQWIDLYYDHWDSSFSLHVEFDDR